MVDYIFHMKLDEIKDELEMEESNYRLAINDEIPFRNFYHQKEEQQREVNIKREEHREEHREEQLARQPSSRRLPTPTLRAKEFENEKLAIYEATSGAINNMGFLIKRLKSQKQSLKEQLTVAKELIQRIQAQLKLPDSEFVQYLKQKHDEKDRTITSLHLKLAKLEQSVDEHRTTNKSLTKTIQESKRDQTLIQELKECRRKLKEKQQQNAATSNKVSYLLFTLAQITSVVATGSLGDWYNDFAKTLGSTLVGSSLFILGIIHFACSKCCSSKSVSDQVRDQDTNTDPEQATNIQAQNNPART